MSMNEEAGEEHEEIAREHGGAQREHMNGADVSTGVK